LKSGKGCALLIGTSCISRTADQNGTSFCFETVTKYKELTLPEACARGFFLQGSGLDYPHSADERERVHPPEVASSSEEDPFPPARRYGEEYHPHWKVGTPSDKTRKETSREARSAPLLRRFYASFQALLFVPSRVRSCF